MILGINISDLIAIITMFVILFAAFYLFYVYDWDKNKKDPSDHE